MSNIEHSQTVIYIYIYIYTHTNSIAYLNCLFACIVAIMNMIFCKAVLKHVYCVNNYSNKRVDLTLAVENPAHSDFLKLRNMLVRTHMQDLKDVTRETLRELPRSVHPEYDPHGGQGEETQVRG